MGNPERYKVSKRTIIVPILCVTNDSNDPRYFKDYYEEREVKVRRAK